MDHRLEELQRGHDDDADISASTVRPSHNIAAAAAAAAPYPAGSHYQAGPSSEGPQELGVLMPGQTWEQNREQFQGTFGRSSQGSLLSTSSPSGGRPSGESLARLGFIPGTSAGAGMGRSASADGVSPPVESGSTKGKGKERELHALPAEHWQDQPGMLGPVAQHSKDASGSTDRTERRAPSPALGVPPSGSGQTFGSTATGKRSRSQSPLPHTYGVGERGGSDFGPLARVLTNEQRQYLADREGGAEETDESAGQLAPPTRGRTGRSKSSPTLPLRVLPASPRLGPQGDPPIGQRSIGRGRTDSDRGGSGSGSRTGRRGRGTSRPERALSSPSRPRPCSTSGLVDVMLTGDAAERQRRRRTPPSWAPTPPVRSDSIPRRTPTLSFPPYGLPVGHRASMIASSDAPAESSNEALRAAFTKRRSRVSATRSMAATQAYASGHGSPGRASGYGYPAYLAGDSEGLGLGLSEPGHTHASLSTLTASQARARARWHLSSLATLRPRLPEDSAIVLAKLRYDSVFARVHHVFLPILAYAHVPATIFLDYNAIYTLVQVALHPETDADGESRGGVRAAWWIAMGVYAAMFVIWLFGIVVAYEALWCFVRHWRTKRPLALPLYLSSPAFTLTAIKSFSLYSFLWRVRLSASRRDFFIESCWYYSQNWPTVLSLLPRAGLCAVLLVLFTPAGTTSIPASPRDDTYFDVDNSTLTTYAFAVLIINAGWAAWRLGVLFLAWLGLSVTLGFRALFARYRDEESRIENLRLDALHGSRSQGSGGRLVDWDESGTLHDTTSTGFSRLAWKARAEERIREALAIALPTVFSPSASEPIGSPAEHEAGLLSSAKAHERKRPDPRSPGLSEPSSHTLSPMVALSGTPNPSAFIPPMKPDAASASEYVEYVDEPETGDDRQREEGMGDGYDRLPLQSPGPEVERPMTLPSGLIVSMTDLPVLVHAQDRKRLSWNDSAQMLATNTSGLAMGTVRDPHSEAQPETSQDDSSSDERHESDVQMQRNSQISGSSQATGAPSISYPFPSKSTSPTKPACSESESHETGAGAGGSPSPDARSLLAPPTFVTAPASSAAEQAASQVVAQPISPLALSAQVPKTKPTRAERASSSFSSLASSLRVGGRGRSSSEAEAEGPGSDEGETAGSGTGGRGSKLLSAAGSLFSSSRSEHRASREGGDAWWAMGLGGRSNRGSDEQARQDNSPGSSTAGHAIASDADKTTPPLPSTSTPPTSSLKTDTVAAATAASSSGENEGNCHARPLPPSNTDANISHVEEQASPPSSPVSARTQDSVSALSESTDDSEERRLWASFPEQSRRHPPGLIALGLEQQAAASAAAAAAAAEAGTRTPTLGSSPVLSASPTGLREFGVLPDGQVSLSANVNANASAMGGDPSDATANANANAQKHPLGAGAPGGSALSTSPSKGGLRPIKEESWSSSLDSASGSTGSKNTNASSQGAPSRGASGASGT